MAIYFHNIVTGVFNKISIKSDLPQMLNDLVSFTSCTAFKSISLFVVISGQLFKHLFVVEIVLETI